MPQHVANSMLEDHFRVVSRAHRTVNDSVNFLLRRVEQRIDHGEANRARETVFRLFDGRSASNRVRSKGSTKRQKSSAARAYSSMSAPNGQDKRGDG